MAVPKHLSRKAKKIYRDLVDEYAIADVAGLEILKTALEAFDRAQSAREQIDLDGMTMKDRYGQTKPHPLLANERDSRAGFLAGLKSLNLDIEPLGRPGRPGSK